MRRSLSLPPSRPLPHGAAFPGLDASIIKNPQQVIPPLHGRHGFPPFRANGWRTIAALQNRRPLLLALERQQQAFRHSLSAPPSSLSALGLVHPVAKRLAHGVA